jgi:hypothetical protein
MTIQETISKLRAVAKDGLELRYAFPYVQVCLTHASFTGKTTEDREELAAQWLGISIGRLRAFANGALITFHWLAPGEQAWVPELGDHWIYGAMRPAVPPVEESRPTIVHFFGYKGGQARSSVLAILGRSLAEAGLRVLIMDADLEAPSLPTIVAKQPRLAVSTLLGLYHEQDADPVPIPCVSVTGGGALDLLAARLPEEAFDWDYDAFTLKVLIDPSVPKQLGARIRNYATNSAYDVLFVDQRTGSSPGTLNWFDALPGGYCVFARLDGQWKSGKRFYSTIARLAPSYAAAVVSFKPDEENPDTYRSRNADQISELSRVIENAFFEKLPPPTDEIDPAEGVADIDRWVLWPYDQAFRLSQFPATSELSHNTVVTLDRISRLLSLPESPRRKSTSSIPSLMVPGHHSGLLDAGTLIQTDVLRDLLQPNSAVNYIFGRKGTGKSRLFVALAEKKMGVPLVADDNYQGLEGLRSHDVKEITEKRLSNVPVGFWWRLLCAALKGPSRESLRTSIHDDDANDCTSLTLKSALTSGPRRVFLIDGLETAFGPHQIESCVNGIFEVMRIIQAEPEIRENVEVKLFLRTDLKQRAGIQNLEQQIHGRARYLSWDLQSILNFMLSRIASSACPLFLKKFPDHIGRIETRQDEIREAAVPAAEAFDLMLPMFPERIRRVNAKMQTFIELHFADSSSEGGNYYPRFVQSFLDYINNAEQGASASVRFRGDVFSADGRLTSAVVQYAYDEAAKQFLSEVRQELQFVLEIANNQIDPFLEAFAGQATPFRVDEMVQTISNRVPLQADVVRDALDKLKSMGIFELRPGYENLEWRAGRIFRSALKMKLRR